MSAERVIVIPARHGSTRFPGKPLALLRGSDGRALPLIAHTWHTARQVPGIARVIVATDDVRIADAARGIGADAVLTPATCRNGTERCAAVLAQLPRAPDLVINLQGDAPLTPPAAIAATIARIADDPALGVATPAVARAPGVAAQPGEVRVRIDPAGRATRFARDARGQWLHLGLYAYRPEALRAYAAAPPDAAETETGLEQLRFLALGIPVGVACCRASRVPGVECNYPHDIARIERALALQAMA